MLECAGLPSHPERLYLVPAYSFGLTAAKIHKIIFSFGSRQSYFLENIKKTVSREKCVDAPCIGHRTWEILQKKE